MIVVENLPRRCAHGFDAAQEEPDKRSSSPSSCLMPQGLFGSWPREMKATWPLLDAVVEKCNKAGCTKESMEVFMKSAEGILSKEQMATLKAECDKHHDKKDAKA